MLYCEECREGSLWPKTITGEYGKCYICGRITFCNSEDVKIVKYNEFNLGLDPINSNILFGKAVKMNKDL